MHIGTARHDIPYENLRRWILNPLILCKAEPLAAVHVVKLEELRMAWDTTFAMKLALDDKASEAQALLNNVVVTLDRSAGRVSKAALTITSDHREDPLYTAYFGDKSLSEFKRRFRPKLVAMRGWPQSLKQSGHASLAALADEVEQSVKAVDAALLMREEVKAEKRYFRDVGERRKLIEKTNAVCKSIHGELSKLPHELPGLPADFADRFFWSESRDVGDDEEAEGAETVEGAKARIATLKEDLAKAEEQLKKAEEREVAAAEEAALVAAEKKALADLEVEVAKKAAQAAKLKAKLQKRVSV